MRHAPRRPELPAAWLAELRALVALAWPLALTNAIEMALNLTSLALIGRIGAEALAASTLALALYNVALLFGIGVTAAVAPLVSRETGRGPDTDAAVGRIARQGFWGAALIAAPAWVVLWNGAPILVALGQDPGLADRAAGYLHALQWSLLPALSYLVLRSLFAALGRPRWAVATGAAAVAVNALLNWLLIGGHAGLPALGLVGSGVATLVANVFLAAALAAVALIDPRLRRVRVFTGLLRPDWTGFAAFWRLGLPIGLSLVLETGMFASAALIVGRLDAPSLAAHAIALQVASMMFMVPLGIAQAATIRIGRASGAGDAAGVARAGWTGLGLGFAVMAASAVVLLTAPNLIIDLFLGGGEPGVGGVRRIAVILLGLAGLFQIADGAQVVLAGMLRGLQDAQAAMVIAAIGYWGIGLPLGAVLAFTFGLRAPGVWLGLSAGLFAAAGLLLSRWLRLLRHGLGPVARDAPVVPSV